MANALHNRRILLVVTGGIAAYKSLDLIRRLREQGARVRCVLTRGGAQFVTPLSVSALSEEPVYSDLFSLTEENQMGHIRLSREADLVVVAPASADFMAKMAQGLADDLASTIMLATDKPVMLVPAMNVMMWQNPAMQANAETLRRRGVKFIGPVAGIMACGEQGEGRMAEVPEILAAINDHFAQPGLLTGLRALVTSGPTHEPLDPVRFIGNRSSGKQGHAIATALFAKGAEIVLVTGPTQQPDPAGVRTIHIETAREMMDACEAALPVDIAICAAAVADWRPAESSVEKLKKGAAAAQINLVENPDILAQISQAGNRRPKLVVGFAAETGDLLKNAAAKLQKKNCDWIVANEVGAGKGFDTDENQVALLRRDDATTSSENWPRMGKDEIARRLTDKIISFFKAA